MQNATIKKYQPYEKRHLLPGAMPFVVGAILYGTVLVTILPDSYRLAVLSAAFVVAVAAAAALSALSASYQRHQIAVWRIVLAPTLLVSGAFLFHLLVGSTLARFSAVTVVMLLLIGFVMRLDALTTGKAEAVEQAITYNRLISLAGIFSLAVFSFGIRQFVQLPAWLAAVTLGSLMFIVAYEASLQAESDVLRRQRIFSSLATGLLGAELYVGLTFLPTPFMVNAVALLVGFFAIVRASVRILRGDAGTKELRVGLAVAAALVVLVLATARWN
ncbi:MAG: hypothetical protein V1738_05705 [Patescibacteria group bacterium]